MSALANPRHEAFCQQFLLDLNATAAYRRTYPKVTAKSARTNGSRLLANAGIQRRVAELREKRAARVEVSQDTVLRELLILACSDPRHFTVTELGHLELAAGAPDASWRAVASVKHRTTHRGRSEDESTVHEVEYRFWSKPEALRMLGEHLALFKQVHQISGLASFARRVEGMSDDELAQLLRSNDEHLAAVLATAVNGDGAR